jgi:hypothetical protein
MSPCGCAAGPGLPRRTPRLRQRSAHVNTAPPQQAPTPGAPTEREHAHAWLVSKRRMALGPKSGPRPEAWPSARSVALGP